MEVINLFKKILVILILFLSFSPLFAQDTVRHIFESVQEHKELEEILYLTTGVDFIEYGLSSTLLEIEEGFIFKTRYEQNGSEWLFHYTFYSVFNPGIVLSEAQLAVEMDYLLEAPFTQTIEILLSRAGISKRNNQEAQILGILPERAEFEESEDSISPQGESDSELSADIPLTSNGDDTGEPPHWNATMTGSLFLFFGDITSYFHYGAGLEMQLLRQWSLGENFLAAGVEGSFLSVFKDPGVFGGDLYLGSLGPVLQLSFDPYNSYLISLGLSGGLSSIIVSNNGNTLSKWVPYGKLSVQSQFPVTDKFYLGGGLSFLSVFDKETLIMAVSPTLMGKVEF